MIIDTHCHLDFPEFKNDVPEVISRAKEKGVEYIINIASNIGNCYSGRDLSEKYSNVFYTVGIHPHHASEVSESQIKKLDELLDNDKKLLAIGEIGLDFYKNFSPRAEQEKIFKYFLNAAKKYDKPAVIHCREAKDQTMDILRNEFSSSVKAVMHCFSQDKEYLKSVLDAGMYVSFTCNITFKNASSLREVVKYVPLDRMMLETDAPYLAPQELRGKRNEPAYLTYLVKELARILNISENEIMEKTSGNAMRFFGIKTK